MNHDQLTFGDCAELLRMNGYVPAPLSPDTGRPLGPFAAMQIPYEGHDANCPLPCGVLTLTPLAKGPADPTPDARDTWLVTITVHVRPELAAETGAIVSRYVGDACPARVEEDGGLRYVLRLTGDAFSALTTDHNDEGDFLRVNAAPDFVPLAGEWTPHHGLLAVRRKDLPEMDRERAQALVASMNALLDQHAPPLPVPSRYVPRPMPNLAAGERLEFGHALAIHRMRENGYEVCPVPWGSARPSDSWFMTASLGVRWNPETDAMGVGVFCALNPTDNSTWLSVCEIAGEDPDQMLKADATVVAYLGAGLLRVASDGTRMRVYRQTAWDRLQGERRHVVTPEPFVPGKSVTLRLASVGSVVVSGVDAAGKPYLWPEGSPLSVKRAALPELAGSAAGDHLLAHVRAALAATPGGGRNAPPAAKRAARRG